MPESSDYIHLQNILSKISGCILYTPLTTELDWSGTSFPFSIPKDVYILPADKSTDPDDSAKQVMEHFKNKTPYILIPGKEFDLSGTRHGRGGGWYDRFLLELPKTWPRIGVLKKEQLSITHLKRESWDQPMDWLIVEENGKWEIYNVQVK